MEGPIGDGTYISASAAKAEGWVDSILELPKPQRLVAKVSFDVRAFVKPPDNLAQAVAQAVAGCTCPCQPCVDGDCAGCTDEDCDCEGCTCDVNDTSAKSRKKAAAAVDADTQAVAAKVAARARSLSLQLVELD